MWSSWQSAHQQMCSLSVVWEEFTPFKGTGGLSVHVFLPVWFRSLLLLSFGHSQQHRELEWGGRAWAKRDAFRTLDDVAVLHTTDWAYSRPTSFCFLLLFGFFLNYHYWKKFRQKAMPLYIIFCVCDDSYILLSEQSLIMRRIIQHHIQQGCKHGYQKYH